MIKLGFKDFNIGNIFPAFVIAEIGVNHNGSLELAKRQIEMAKKAGADCVKFQSFRASEIVTDDAPKAQYQLSNTSPNESQKSMLEGLEFSEVETEKLIAFAKEIGIIFLSTPYSFNDAIMLKKLGVGFFKLASLHCGEPLFIKRVCDLGLPIVLSTGMSIEAEVDIAVKILRDSTLDFAILQCTTNYPCALSEVNLNVIDEFKEKYNCLVGFSDHTQSNLAILGAIAKGAKIIEKHFTSDKNLPGPDHSCSMEPCELKNLIIEIRHLEDAMGSSKKKLQASEENNIKAMRRSLFFSRDLPKGHRLTYDDIILKRPYTGIPASDANKVVGKLIIADVSKDSKINWTDLQS